MSVDMFNPVIDATKSGAITNASAQIVPANRRRKYLLIQNLDTLLKVGINPGGTAAIGSPGTITLLPGGTLTFEGNNGQAVPQNAFSAIAESGTPSLTVWEILG